MLLYRLSDLPDNLRRQAERQLSPSPRRPATAPVRSPMPPSASLSPDPYAPKSSVRPPSRDDRGEPNATERDYNDRVLGGNGRYEPLVLRLPGGNYTPDWMTIDDGIPTFHECKGSYRFGSESRARLAFLSAAAAFPFWRFVWAQREKGGRWNVRLAVNLDTPETALSEPPSKPSAPHQAESARPPDHG